MVNKPGLIIFSIVAIISIFSILGISFNPSVEAQTENNATETKIQIFLKDARDNQFTGGLTYTPDYVMLDRGGNTTPEYFDIAQGFTHVSISETNFSYTFSIKIPVPDTDPGAFAITKVNEQADVWYIDTVSNYDPEWVSDNNISQTDNLNVYFGKSNSLFSGIATSPNKVFEQISPTDAVIIFFIYEK